MDKEIIIEVGSHTGTDTEHLLKENSILYCFEPNHELYANLYNKYKYNNNVFVFPFAVDKQSGFRQFNVQTVANKGCSSLNNFNQTIGDVWKDRTDFSFGDMYMVPTISLKDFINMYRLPRIDYLWIDAQGSDFDVIHGLGDKLHMVQNGKCEAALNVALYENTDNHYLDIVRYLEGAGFLCEVYPDQSGINAECDIYFTKN